MNTTPLNQKHIYTVNTVKIRVSNIKTIKKFFLGEVFLDHFDMNLRF